MIKKEKKNKNSEERKQQEKINTMYVLFGASKETKEACACGYYNQTRRGGVRVRGDDHDQDIPLPEGVIHLLLPLRLVDAAVGQPPRARRIPPAWSHMRLALRR
jgi:hypothetical protein